MKTKYHNIKFTFKVVFIFWLLLNSNLSFGKNFVSETPEVVKAWEALFSSSTIRKNIDDLTTVDGYFKANPGKIDEFKGQFDDITTLTGKRTFVDDHAEYNRASKLSSQDRVNELAFDPKNNSTDLYEGELGQLVESNYGYFKRDPTGAGDFIGLTGAQRGKVIDVFGIPQSAIQHHGDDLANFLPSVDQHFYKVQSGAVDILELDIRAMNATQVQTLQNYIGSNWSNLSSQLNYIQ